MQTYSDVLVDLMMDDPLAAQEDQDVATFEAMMSEGALDDADFRVPTSAERTRAAEDWDRNRFIEMYEKKDRDQCWPWTGKTDRDGYGRFYLRSLGYRMPAQRAAWHLFRGNIPKTLHVLHHCDNPGCVNYVKHLWPGTHAQNMADMAAKGRSARGERNGNSELTLAEALLIRSVMEDGGNAQEVAEEFDITPGHARSIGRGDRWGWLADEAHSQPLNADTARVREAVS